jgi:quercetin dioxygenase-like cupin family protein
LSIVGNVYFIGGITMSKLQALYSDALPESAATPGITRYLAFEGEGYRILRSRTDPGVISGWHHHGDYEVYGFVVSGSGRFEDDQGGAVSLGPGDFVHVPPHTVHREINPSTDKGNEMILFLRGTGTMVFNLED